MKSDPVLDGLLARDALDALEPDERTALEHALAARPWLAAELDAYRAVAGDLAASVPAVQPAPSVRDRLFASLDALVRPGRLDAFAPQMAALFGVTIDKARMFLGDIDDPRRWQPMGIPGIRQQRLRPGPAWARADCRVVQMAAGSRFPRHVHDGYETTLVLDGHARFDTGIEVGPGDEVEAPPGILHGVEVERETCVFAVRSFGITLLAPHP